MIVIIISKMNRPLFWFLSPVPRCWTSATANDVVCLQWYGCHECWTCFFPEHLSASRDSFILPASPAASNASNGGVYSVRQTTSFHPLSKCMLGECFCSWKIEYFITITVLLGRVLARDEQLFQFASYHFLLYSYFLENPVGISMQKCWITLWCSKITLPKCCKPYVAESTMAVTGICMERDHCALSIGVCVCQWPRDLEPVLWIGAGYANLSQLFWLAI